MDNSNWTGKLLVGGFLVLIGLAMFFDQVGLRVLGVNMWNLWPLFFVLLGLIAFSKRNFIGGIILLFLGAAFLSSNFLGISLWSLWPLFFVFLGLWILVRPRPTWRNVSGTTTQNKFDENVMFWALDKKVRSENFTGGTVNAMFGGFKIDLSEAKIADGSKLTLNAMFGGGEVIIPRDVNVEVTGTGFFGGWENKAAHGTGPTLKIDGSMFFGGIEIRN